MKRIHFVHVAALALLAALAVPAAGVSKGGAVPSAVGPGEGKLTLVAWEGYTEKQWVAPFEKLTGCKVSVKYAGSSNDMFNLMTAGGGGQYDMVSASGDASLRLIYAGAVAETNMALIPNWKDFFNAFKSPANNTVDGKHYGVSVQFGPNVLMYNTKAFPKKPTSWKAIYDPANKGNPRAIYCEDRSEREWAAAGGFLFNESAYIDRGLYTWRGRTEARATDHLKLPHPGIAERDFVLYPLADIAPDLDVPGKGRVASLRERVANRGVAKL